MSHDLERVPPSIDALARSLTASGLPHRLLVDMARDAIANNDVEGVPRRAIALRRQLLGPVVNATGVLLHTNLGRAPFGVNEPACAVNLEFDLESGGRGQRAQAVGRLLSVLCGAEAALVVNNGAAAVLLALAATSAGRDVVVSRGESVEIGGGFRIPEILNQSGARLVDVGTTNRTRLSDFVQAIEDPAHDVASVLRVHTSNFVVLGFTESASVSSVAQLGIPVIVDLGSGLVDARCPWLPGPPPTWLHREPAARQTLEAGAALVTFSCDKLLGGPQAGVIAGRSDLVSQCAQHALSRALRPGRLVLAALQDLVLMYLRDEAASLPFWRQATASIESLSSRASALLATTRTTESPSTLEMVESEAVPGAGSVPGVRIPSVALVLSGDHLAPLRRYDPPVVARIADGRTLCDLRTVAPDQDKQLAAAVSSIIGP